MEEKFVSTRFIRSKLLGLRALLTEYRDEIMEWFRRSDAASLGELYDGALRMISDAGFPGRTRFVAHAVREIRNRLPKVIAGTTTKRFDCINRLDALAKARKRAGFLIGESVSPSLVKRETLPSSDIASLMGFLRKVDRIIKEHIEARERPRDAAMRLFEGVDPGNAAFRDRLRPVIKQWLYVTGWFVKRVHDSGSQDLDTPELDFQERFRLFEQTLAALIRGFYSTLDELDEILEETNK